MRDITAKEFSGALNEAIQKLVTENTPDGEEQVVPITALLEGLAGIFIGYVSCIPDETARLSLTAQFCNTVQSTMMRTSTPDGAPAH